MSEEENWTLEIKPKRKLLDIPIREIFQYREMLFLFVKRDFVMQYKQTVLGPLWFVINPLLSTIIFTFVFGQLARIGTDGIPHTLFYYSGTMLWAFFSGCFNDSCNVFISNSGLFGKVYFPRLVIPINYALSNAIKIAVQFVLLLVFLMYFILKGYPVNPSWFVLLLPFLIVWLAAIGVGAGIIISSLTTKYRDLNKLVVHALTLAMYVSPVVYPLSEIPARFSWIAFINPVCAPIELFRRFLFGSGTWNVTMILSSIGITLLLVFGGLILFNQNEQNFIDVI
jgi:lipopolysaccharide transport system permease protein